MIGLDFGRGGLGGVGYFEVSDDGARGPLVQVLDLVGWWSCFGCLFG